MTDFNAIQIKVASPEDILRWSHGEVLKPETINYRTQRPEKDGLFSERIFGPTKDWECYCGKYRRIRYKGVTCDKCGVEVTRAIVRRERMGHIVLAAPVVHVWFLRSAPSRIGLLLDISVTKLEKVVYYAAYIITSVDEDKKKDVVGSVKKEAKKSLKKSDDDEGGGSTTSVHDLRVGHVVSETDYWELKKNYGGMFKAETGAGAIRAILEDLDLKKLVANIKKEIENNPDAARETRLLARLKMATSMVEGGIRPEWMIMTVLPVLPPDLRPMVALDGGRYATSDLNDLYRRVINRNNRLKKLLELKAPDVIVRNEKRMLQEAVDALIDNSSRLGTTQQLSSQRRPLRSLADMLKGKTGRFRQNLLGKRVDYSGRSVIVVGPQLKLNQCGLPKKMALEIFRPFVVAKIIERGLAFSIKNANRMIEDAPGEVWEILEEVIGDKKVLLNRAPTLHRLGIQAFNPLLIEELAIQIPPMVCTAFNADFDGDQMAVHLPLTQEAQKEATEKMLSSVNLLKPATGDPITTPTQDIVLGCYYLTLVDEDIVDMKDRAFASEYEAVIAYEAGILPLHAMTCIGAHKTTVGRAIFNRILPPGFEFVNTTLSKKVLSEIVRKIIQQLGVAEATQYLDRIKELGFFYASRSGISWGMDDLITPREKEDIMLGAERDVALIRDQYDQGLLTDEERRIRIIDVWSKAKKALADIVPKSLPKGNSVHHIINSGSRGSWAQPVQMMGMKGLIQDPQGATIELPIKSSFKEGFGVLEYFISAYGGRKGTTDTALKTASAGYLTRRLVDVAQDVLIRDEDCKAKEGVEIFRVDGLDLGYAFSARIFSRTALHDIKLGNKILVRAGEIINRAQAEAIDKAESIESIVVRSPITCTLETGICVACYGGDLGSGNPVAMGEAVGIIAAQSIGEPGTQLTMRTFHVGGVAGADITHGLPRVEEVFEARSPKGKAILAECDGVVDAIDDKGLVKTIAIRVRGKGKKEKIIEYSAQGYVEFLKKVGDEVVAGDRLTSGSIDPKELFRLKGTHETERYIVRQIQKIYLSEGASINNKHIEIIVRQMLSKSRITDSGDTSLIKGEIVSRARLMQANAVAKKSGGSPAKAEPLIMGITRVATLTDSFLSSASFQETARALVKASIEGRLDELQGLKENVIIGRLIPVGPSKKGTDSAFPFVPDLHSGAHEGGKASETAS